MFRRSTCILIVACTVVSSLSLAACGGSDSKTTDASSTVAETAPATTETTVASTKITAPAGLSTAQLVTKAGAICTRVRADMGALTPPASFAEAEAAFAKMLAVSSQGVTDLKALPAVGSDATTMATFITTLTAANVALADSVTAAHAGDEAAANTASERYGKKVQEFAAAANVAGFAECGAGAPATAEAPNTTPQAAPVSALTVVDLSSQLKPITGFSYVALPAEVETGLVTTFEKTPGVVDLMRAVGVTQVKNTKDQAILILLGTKRPLVGDELKQFISGVVGDGTGVQEIEVAGTKGWAYVDNTGKQAFVTVRNDTAVLAIAETTDVLSTVVTGLFEANPDI